MKKNILLSDRPDLRIPLYHHGIEVTQALTPEEAVADMKKPLYKTLDMTPFDHDDQNIWLSLSAILVAAADRYRHCILFRSSHTRDGRRSGKIFQCYGVYPRGLLRYPHHQELYRRAGIAGRV